MFVKYFNLNEQPFGATPDPRFLYRGSSHREALASLHCAYYANRGFTALIAKPGMGKTTLLYEFLDNIRARSRTVYLFNTFFGPDDVVAQILRDSGIRPGRTVAERFDQLNRLLAEEARAGRNLVLVVDEAQNLSEHTLEGIRLLTNFETARAKLMQIVLAGQPQLANKLVKPDLAQLRQRISTFCRIAPFTAEETERYIDHRLKFAGYSGSPLFSPRAIDRIAQTSAGIPRVINTLCFNSLCLCRARNEKRVELDMIEEAIADLELPEVQSIATPSSVPQPAIVSQSELSSRAETEEVVPHSSHLRKILFAASLVLGVSAGLVGIRLLPAHVSAHMNPFATHSSAQSSTAPVTDQSSLGSAIPDSTVPALSVPPQLGSARKRAAEPQKKDDPRLIWVTVVEGDKLEDIATRYLGRYDDQVLKEILQLNPKLKDPNHIEKGGILRLPAPGSPPTTIAQRD